MKFSNRHNALYSVSSAAMLLATMCREGICAEQASRMLKDTADARSPDADWLLGRLGSIGYVEMEIRHTTN